MKNLGANFEHWKTCDWAYPSILAYNEIHHNELDGYGKDFSENLDQEEIVQYLYTKGISSRMEDHRGTVQKQSCQTITTHGGNDVGVVVSDGTLKRELCNKLIQDGLVEEGDVIRHSYSSNRLNNGEKNMGRIESKDKLCPTLDTRCDCLGVVVGTYDYAKSDNFMQGKDRLNLGNDISGTLLASGNQNGVAIRYGSYYTWEDKQGNINTQCNRAADEDGYALTVACANTGNVGLKQVGGNLRIRKLTPKETTRLMGFSDEDYDAMKKVLSDAMIFHCCGDSIITNCLAAIFSHLLGVEWRP